MKLLPVLFALLLVIAAKPFVTMAADGQDPGPEFIKFKMGDLYLTFKHWNHQKWSNQECFHCHTSKEWKIKNWDKDVAHQVCIPCHDEGKKGPVDCKDCHGPPYTSMLEKKP
jgi:hypothetical protein